jgi:hypothetical protein
MNGIWLMSYIALWVVVAFMFILLVSILRHVGILYRQGIPGLSTPTALRTGEKAPDLHGMTRDGNAVRLSQVVSGPTQLIIVSPRCSGCSALLAEIAHGHFVAEDGSGLAILSIGSMEDTEELLGAAGSLPDVLVLVDTEKEARQLWGVRITPSTIAVDEHLTVLRQAAGGRTAAGATHEHPLTSDVTFVPTEAMVVSGHSRQEERSRRDGPQ